METPTSSKMDKVLAIIPTFKEIRSKHIAMLAGVILAISVCVLGYMGKIPGNDALLFCGSVLTLCGSLADGSASNKG